MIDLIPPSPPDKRTNTQALAPLDQSRSSEEGRRRRGGALNRVEFVSDGLDCCPMDGINGLIQLTPSLAIVIPRMVSDSVMSKPWMEDSKTSGERGFRVSQRSDREERITVGE